MRTIHKIIDLQMSLYHQRVNQRHFLSDVPYENLCPEARQDMEERARQLYHPLMERETATVWRFLTRN